MQTQQEDLLYLIQQLGPDLAEEMARRSLVLERISLLEPVGRRQLAARLNLTEREIRAMATALRDQNLIQLDASGMMLTEKGRALLPQAAFFLRAMGGLPELEMQVAQRLNIGRVCIVPGDMDQDEHVLQDVARTAAQKIRSAIRNGSTIAVTGGNTIAQMTKHMQSPVPMNVMVVPARGGMGRSIEMQANTIAAELATKLGGHHRLLHLPDHMDEAARHELLKLPEVSEAMALIQRANVILHGIGRADVNMRVNQLPAHVVRELERSGAVGECFGAYFDQQGQCLLESSSVGVDLARLSSDCQMMAVAAGASKAEAIIAVMRYQRHTLLVTDEGAARRILALCT